MPRRRPLSLTAPHFLFRAGPDLSPAGPDLSFAATALHSLQKRKRCTTYSGPEHATCSFVFHPLIRPTRPSIDDWGSKPSPRLSTSGTAHRPMERGKKASCTSAAQPAQPSTSASAGSAAQPAGESKQLPALDAPSPRACTEESPQLRFAEDFAAAATAGRAALQTIDRNTTEGAAISAAINAGRGARAEGSTDEEAIAAAHEAAGTVLSHSPERRAAWRTSDAALIAECWIVGTRTQRYGTEEENIDPASTVALRRSHTLPSPTHENH